LLVTGFFTLAACLNSYPLVRGVDSTIGEHGDSFFSVWRLAWVAHQIRNDPGRLFDTNIFFPESGTLAYSDAMLVPALAVAPLHWLGVSPLLVYNLTLLAAFVASGVAAYALVRHLTGSTAAAVLGGLIFAFAPYRMEHFDHLELQFAFWIPLVALAWHRAAERDELTDHLKVGALTAAQILSSIYYGIFLLTWLGFITVLWHVRAPRRAARAIVFSLALPLAVMAIYSVPYQKSHEAVGDRKRSEVAEYSARPLDFLSAPETNQFYGGTAQWGANERHLFPGAVALALLVVGLWRASDRRLLIHAAGLAFSLALTLGFNAGLYTLLYDWVLPFRGLRVPARAGILVLLGVAVLGGAGLARVLRRARSRTLANVAAIAVTGACVAEYRTSPRLVEVDPRPAALYATLRDMPDAVVFEWPVTVPSRLDLTYDVHYMYRSTEHWRPLLNGYSGNYPRSYLELLNEMRSFPRASALRYLRQRGATVLVVHERRDSRPPYGEVLIRLHRDPNVAPIVESRYAGSRVAFFRLQPVPGAVKDVESRLVPDGR
jgi:hypothetical protein